MKLSNPLQMNDWEIEKFLKVVLAIHIAMCGAICLDVVGLQIPIIRPLIGFIYLTFVPGILIIRIIRLHKISNIETLLYTVGLSLATLMFTGFFMNMIYPSFGISGPISLTPLITTISAVVLVLCILCYARDKDFADPGFIDLEEVLSPPVLFLCLIPFMAVLGTYLVNFYHTNILLMLMIVVIALVALLIGFDKFIPVKLYPLAIWVMAISLIWHSTLISSYINVCDVVREYSISNLVIDNSFWDWTISGSYNAVLSNAMLAPISHLICGLDLTWVFKTIYPLLFSFVSLGSYFIFLKETKNNKIAFFSSFLLISTGSFYGVVAHITKQTTAEIFLVLLFMAMLTKDMDKLKKSFLSMVFGISLIVSHYGTSYLVMFSLIFVWLFLFLTDDQTVKKLSKNLYSKFRKEERGTGDSNTKNKATSLTFILLYLVFAVMWYMYVSSSSTFNQIVHMGEHVINSVYIEFLNPEYSRGLNMLTKELASPLHTISRDFYLITQFFIVVGLLKTLLNTKNKKLKFDKLYLGFSIYFFILLLAAIAHTSLSAMDPRRLYHLSLFVLAPFSVIGGLTTCEMIYKIFKRSWTNENIKYSLNILSVFLAIFLLFNTGFMYEVAKDHPGSSSISQESIKQYGDLNDKAGFYGGYIVTQNVFSGKWLATNMKNNEIIYRGDWVQGYPSLTIYGGINEKNIQSFDNTTTEIGHGFVQLSYLNVVEGVGSSWYNPLQRRTAYNFTEVYPLLADKSRIYDNGGSEILWSS